MMNVARTENTRKGTCSAGWPIPFVTEETSTTMTNSLTSSTPYDFRRARRTSHSPKLPPLAGQGASRKARRMKPQAGSGRAKPKAQTHCVHTTSYQPYHHRGREQTELHKKGETKILLLPIVGLSRASSALRFLTPRESALPSHAPLELDPQGLGRAVWSTRPQVRTTERGKTLPRKGSNLHISRLTPPRLLKSLPTPLLLFSGDGPSRCSGISLGIQTSSPCHRSGADNTWWGYRLRAVPLDLSILSASSPRTDTCSISLTPVQIPFQLCTTGFKRVATRFASWKRHLRPHNFAGQRPHGDGSRKVAASMWDSPQLVHSRMNRLLMKRMSWDLPNSLERR